MRSTLQKFDGRAQDYVVGRPVYAQEFVEALFPDYGFSSDSVIADIGSGTGKFAGQLLERGCTVYGVEPNDDMKEKAVEELSGFVRFYPVKGTEAGTTLEDHSADFVTTAQAFHWFDVPAFAKGVPENPEARRKGLSDLECEGYERPTESGGIRNLPELLSGFQRVQRRNSERR